jgi:hypothetical protein
MIPLTEIFCLIDDFCKYFESKQKHYILPNLARKRRKPCSMSLSEIIAIVVMFHLSHYRTFKDFYLYCLIPHYRREFPKLLSYNRFVELMPMSFMPMYCYCTAYRVSKLVSIVLILVSSLYAITLEFIAIRFLKIMPKEVRFLLYGSSGLNYIS